MSRILISFVVLLSVSFLLLASRSPAGQFECTAISVPKSENFPIIHNGERTESPAHLSDVYKTILITVELPDGFEPVGGGGGQVVACRKK